jgi:hypothetical protein
MSAVASQLSFEVLRFAAEPVSGEVALLELEGRFRAGTRRRLGVPRLVAEHADGTHEVAPAAADEATAEPDGALWRASYAVSLEELGGGVFSLAVGRELLVGLPAPDPAEGTGDREVRLAREANALRRTADEARAAAAAALASVGAERRAREAAESEVSDVRLARDDLARRVSALEEDLATARRDHAAELVRRDAERQTALSGRDEEAARAADERVAEIEAEVAEARRALRAARAEAEGYRRELRAHAAKGRGSGERRAHAAGGRGSGLEAAEASVRRGRVTEIAGEPVESDQEPLEEPATEVATTAILEQSGTGEAAAAGDSAATPDQSRSTDDATADDAAAGGDTATTPDQSRSTADDAAAGGDTATPDPIRASPGETVRVLGARRPRRTGEGPPADAAPGTAAIGARFIEPGQTPRRSALAIWLTRLLALAALAVAIVAVLLVVKPF